MSTNESNTANLAEHSLSKNAEINVDFNKDFMVVVVDNLPSGYSYHFLSIKCPNSGSVDGDNFVAEFRIKEVDCERAIYVRFHIYIRASRSNYRHAHI